MHVQINIIFKQLQSLCPLWTFPRHLTTTSASPLWRTIHFESHWYNGLQIAAGWKSAQKCPNGRHRLIASREHREGILLSLYYPYNVASQVVCSHKGTIRFRTCSRRTRHGRGSLNACGTELLAARKRDSKFMNQTKSSGRCLCVSVCAWLYCECVFREGLERTMSAEGDSYGRLWCQTETYKYWLTTYNYYIWNYYDNYII